MDLTLSRRKRGFFEDSLRTESGREKEGRKKNKEGQSLSCLRFGERPYTYEDFSIAVLCSHNGIEFSGSRLDDAVRQRQFFFVPKSGCTKGRISIQLHDNSFHHQCHRRQGLFFAHLLEDSFEDFVQADRWNDQTLCIFDGGGEKVCLGTVRQIFGPTR